MFCLFKNSRLRYPLNFLVWGISIFGVLYWLNFAFIEKAFLEKFFGGEVLFVDLLLGLPVVLIFALVIYAVIYWGLKVLVILFVPSMVEQIEVTSTPLSDQLEYDDLQEFEDSNDEPPSSDQTDSKNVSTRSDSASKPDEH